MDQLPAGLYLLPHRHPPVCAGGAGEVQHVLYLRLADRLGMLSGAGSGLRAFFPGAAGKGEPQKPVYLLYSCAAGFQSRCGAGAELFLAFPVGTDHGHGKSGRFCPALYFQFLSGAVPLSVSELSDGAERQALHHSGRLPCGGDEIGLSGCGLWRRNGPNRHSGADGADGAVLSGVSAAAAQSL